MSLQLLSGRPALAMLALASRRRSGWVPTPGAVIDFDFVAGQVFGASFADLIVSRATANDAPRSDGTWASFPPDTLRRTDLGLFISLPATNFIRNNSGQGAAAGSPGTLPTHWSVEGMPDGLTLTVSGPTIQQGVEGVNLRFQGTPSESSEILIAFDEVGAIPAARGDGWAVSTYASLADGSLQNIEGLSISILECASDFAPLRLAMQPIALQSSLGRYFLVDTLQESATFYIDCAVSFIVSEGEAIDFGLRLGWPQAEIGDSPTFPIRTVGTAVSIAPETIAPSAFLADALADASEIRINQGSGLQAISLEDLSEILDGSDGLIRRLVILP